jgi:hypothetical protein
MGRFLETEKQRQIAFKALSPTLSEDARRDGVYRGRARPFCLPLEHAEENLYPGIRTSALAYTARHGIGWHHGRDGKPSNHMCSSQVCCVNFMFPFANQPQALAELLRPVYPGLQRMLPIEDGLYVALEWIGEENYLGERVAGRRTRGANCTSADAAVMFERTDGTQQIVLIEWKYTESYGRTCLRYSKSGTDRLGIYLPLLERDDCPIDRDFLPDWDALFYEPFYQLMRQQLLAHEMERARELGTDLVSVLHIAPAHNADFLRVTSPRLAELGDNPTAIWSRLVRQADRFCSVSTEAMFGAPMLMQFPELEPWLMYIDARYAWVNETA